MIFFEIARNYLKNGELVDLHDLKLSGDSAGYEDTKKYLSADGLIGFAITKDGYGEAKAYQMSFVGRGRYSTANSKENGKVIKRSAVKKMVIPLCGTFFSARAIGKVSLKSSRPKTCLSS
ncbi:MAG: hypothetical protein PUC66_07165 [Erysipelotrichaceae bacterium]|nr:hypothetical protein [Erysipelotrichaceae bacterium]